MTEDKKPSWRDVVAIHPVAEVFPLLSPEELHELVEDIRKGGPQQKVLCWTDADNKTWLLDGRNRLDALELAGWEVVKDGTLNPDLVEHTSRAPDAAVISLNIQRRHLNPLERGKLVAGVRKAMHDQNGEVIGEGSPMISAPGGAPKRKGVRGSVKGEVGIVAELAHVDRKTARKSLRAVQQGEQDNHPQPKKRAHPGRWTAKAHHPAPTDAPKPRVTITLADSELRRMAERMKLLSGSDLSHHGEEALSDLEQQIARLRDEHQHSMTEVPQRPHEGGSDAFLTDHGYEVADL